MTFTRKIELEEEYEKWVKEASAEVGAQIDGASLITALTFLNEKGLLVDRDTSNVYTHTDEKLNAIVSEIMNDYKKLVEKAKSHGLDIKYAPNASSTLELYFHDDYPDLILVDKYFSCQLKGE